MEKEEQELELQLLGAMGMVREAFNILLRSSRSKLLWAFALALLLPLTFASLGQNFILGSILLKIQRKQIDAVLRPSETTWHELGLEWRELVGILAADIAIVLVLWMVYTAATMYTDKTKELKVSNVRVLSTDVPRVWKRLMLTFLWFYVTSFGFMMLSMLASGLLLILSFPTVLYGPSVGVEADNKLKSWLFVFNLILVIVIFACPQIYITMVCHLASVVSVLEDKYYGLAAVVKSSNLIKGKRITALVLLMFFLIIDGVIVWLFGYTVVEGRSHGLRTATRAVNGAFLFGLHCFVNVMWMLAQSVLYFVCKSYHHESIDDYSSFKVHQVGEYDPLNTSSIQLERLHAEL